METRAPQGPSSSDEESNVGCELLCSVCLDDIHTRKGSQSRIAAAWVDLLSVCVFLLLEDQPQQVFTRSVDSVAARLKEPAAVFAGQSKPVLQSQSHYTQIIFCFETQTPHTWAPLASADFVILCTGAICQSGHAFCATCLVGGAAGPCPSCKCGEPVALSNIGNKVLETSGTRCDEFHDKIPSTPSRPVRLDRARPSRYLDVEPTIFHTPVPASALRPRKRTHSGHACSSKASITVSFEKVKTPAVLNMPRTKQQQDAASVLSCLLTRVEKVFKYEACAFRSSLRMTKSFVELVLIFLWQAEIWRHTHSGGFVFQRASGPRRGRATIWWRALALLCLFWAYWMHRQQDATHALQWA